MAGKARPTGIKGTAMFTPSTAQGTVTVEFPIPAEVVAQYAGKDLVAFEIVKQGDATVAIHADVRDAGQTVRVPPTPPPPTPGIPPVSGPRAARAGY